MNTRNLSLDYLKKARDRFAALQLLFERDAYADVVREAQEILELITKGALRWVGVEPPKSHDVGETLKKYKDRFPKFWQEWLPQIARWSKNLFEERSEAFYGDEEDGIPSSQLFTIEEAKEVLSNIEKLISLYEQLLDAFPSATKSSHTIQK